MATARLKWLEISADYRCNNRCLGCFSLGGSEASMTGEEQLRALLSARQRGADCLWLGGGEPTLRPDLLGVVRAARRLDYRRILLQTNGMRLAYPAFARQLFEAGVNTVSFSIKGATAATHDALAQTPGCHELMLRAFEACREHGVRIEADLLIYRRNTAELKAMVERYAELGAEHFKVWLFTAAAGDTGGEDLKAEVPQIREVMPHLMAAMDLGLGPREGFITSLHTPPCTIPQGYEGCRFHAASLSLLVANPGGYQFMLEDSAIEGGVYLAGCAACALRPRCGGIRAEYLTLFGGEEFQPVLVEA